MNPTAKSVSTVIATIMLALSVLSAVLAPTSACADEIDPAAAGHGAARVVDTYKTWTSSLYNVGNYDYTYKIINYVSYYDTYGPYEVNTYGDWSPTAELGAWGTVHVWQYKYVTH